MPYTTEILNGKFWKKNPLGDIDARVIVANTIREEPKQYKNKMAPGYKSESRFVRVKGN